MHEVKNLRQAFRFLAIAKDRIKTLEQQNAELLKDAAQIIKIECGFDYPFGKGLCHPTMTITFAKEDWESRDRLRVELDAAIAKAKESRS